MSFDRYVAICKPLRYVTIMNSQLRSLLVITAWTGGAICILCPSVVYFQIPFWGSNTINHFFCDNTQIIQLKCGNTRVPECVNFISVVFILLGSPAVTAVSYINIIIIVFKIPSVTGRQKAFVSCASHLAVVSVTYGRCIFVYLTPTQTNRLDLSKLVSILNTVVSPLLHAFIYSLRNAQFQVTLCESIKWNIIISKHPEI